jgi:hypothetical protein
MLCPYCLLLGICPVCTALSDLDLSGLPLPLTGELDDETASQPREPPADEE